MPVAINKFEKLFGYYTINNVDFVNAITESLSYRYIKIPKEQAFNIYTLRARLFEDNPDLHRQFTSLLAEIESFQEDDVMIHSIILKNKLWLTFSNLDCSLFLGTLVFEGEDNKE